MNDAMIALAREGRWDVLAIVGAVAAVGYVLRLWRAAEARCDELQEARLRDIREIVSITGEIRTALTLITTRGRDGG